MHVTPSAVQFPNDKILLYATKVDGLGDLACIIKIAEMLFENHIFSHENIFISSDKIADFKKLNKYQFQVISLSLRSTNCFMPIKASDLRNRIVELTSRFSLQILYPDAAAGSLMVNCLPTLLLHEYNYPRTMVPEALRFWVQSESLGIATSDEPEHLGICIDQELVEWSKLDEEEQREKAPRFAEELSSGMKQVLFQGQNTNEFFSSNHLFVGHASNSDSWVNFIKTIILRYHNDKANINIVIPLQMVADIGKRLSQVIEVNTLLAVSLKTGKWKSFELTNRGTKDVRIFYGKVKRQDMQCLWKISSRETVVTGDQSLSEAISARKLFTYEAKIHKNDLAEALQTHFGKHVTQISATSFDVAAKTQEMQPLPNALDCWPKLLATIVQLMKSKELSQGCQKLYHSPQGHLETNAFPLRVPVLISIQQLQNMQIDREGKCHNPKLQNLYPNSIFCAELLGMETYTVTRKQI